MSDFTDGRFNNSTQGDAESKRVIGKLQNITSSPEKGRQRLIVKDKKTYKAVAIDMKCSEVSKLDRKEMYEFEVTEKFSSGRFGQKRDNFSSHQVKSYHSDETPIPWEGDPPGGDRWNRFGGSGGRPSGAGNGGERSGPGGFSSGRGGSSRF